MGNGKGSASGRVSGRTGQDWTGLDGTYKGQTDRQTDRPTDRPTDRQGRDFMTHARASLQSWRIGDREIQARGAARGAYDWLAGTESGALQRTVSVHLVLSVLSCPVLSCPALDGGPVLDARLPSRPRHRTAPPAREEREFPKTRPSRPANMQTTTSTWDHLSVLKPVHAAPWNGERGAAGQQGNRAIRAARRQHGIWEIRMRQATFSCAAPATNQRRGVGRGEGWREQKLLAGHLSCFACCELVNPRRQVRWARCEPARGGGFAPLLRGCAYILRTAG
jgi:hypothetical protein